MGELKKPESLEEAANTEPVKHLELSRSHGLLDSNSQSRAVLRSVPAIGLSLSLQDGRLAGANPCQSILNKVVHRLEPVRFPGINVRLLEMKPSSTINSTVSGVAVGN